MTFLLFTCADRVVSRDDWQRMNGSEKTLYVNSLIGAEKARERKGGGERAVVLPAPEIVRQIDAAYALGDQRSPEAIFSTLAVRPDSPAPPRPASP